MATQAKKEENSKRKFANPPRGFENPPLAVWKLGHAGFPQNLRIVIAVKLMVKAENLARLKDGLGLYLEDANITQHLPLHSEF